MQKPIIHLLCLHQNYVYNANHICLLLKANTYSKMWYCFAVDICCIVAIVVNFLCKIIFLIPYQLEKSLTLVLCKDQNKFCQNALSRMKFHIQVYFYFCISKRLDKHNLCKIFSVLAIISSLFKSKSSWNICKQKLLKYCFWFLYVTVQCPSNFWSNFS